MKKLLLTAALLGSLGAAQAADLPKMHAFKYKDGAYIQNISDNGRYAVFCGWLTEDNSYWDYPKVVDLTTNKMTDLTAGFNEGDYTSMGAFDSSNEGIVVGCVGDTRKKENPAYYTLSTGKWTRLSYPSGSWEGGKVYAVSADGKYGVGTVYTASQMERIPVMWTLADKKVVELTNLPVYNRLGEKADGIEFTDISADGRFLFGHVDWYLADEVNGEWGYSFVYDTQDNTWEAIGWQLVDGIPTIPAIKNVSLGNEIRVSPNGRYVITAVYPNAENDEEMAVALYNTETKKYEILEGEHPSDALINAITNLKSAYTASPTYMPIRDWSVLSDGYWVSATQIYKQLYGKTAEELTGIADAVSGTIICSDGSGKMLGSMIYPQGGESYIIEFAEDPAVIAKEVDLLYDYTITPQAGTSFSALSSMEILFDREVEIAGETNAVQIMKGDEPVRASIKFGTAVSSSNLVEIAFRATPLEAGVAYTVVIPAGAIHAKGNAEKCNKEIRIPYYGRANEPINMKSAQPANGDAVAQFNSGTNPVVLTLDATVKVADNASGNLSVLDADGNVSEVLTTVGFLAYQNQVMVYPLINQNLFKGYDYRLTIDAGAFTDVTGGNPSEEIILTYEGIYEREFNANDKYLFYCDFNDTSFVSDFIRWDNDCNNPSAEMQSIGFENSTDYPWWWVRDTEESTDLAIMSHSRYSPVGQSDDWLIIPQLLIPDDRVVLKFKGQRWIQENNDRLKIMVLATNDRYERGSFEFIDRIKKEGVVIFDEVLANEGDSFDTNWKDYAVSLAEFADKYVYVCFVNQNENESGLILDDICLERGLDFLVSLESATQVTQAASLPVSGQIRIENPSETYTELTATLLDAEGSEVDKIEFTGLSAKYGDLIPFKFEKELPLKEGCTNTYKVKIVGGESLGEANGSVDNLLFTPVKRVLIEEGTGQGCTNCPWGHALLERLTDNYGDRVCIAAYHTYDGDNLHSGLSTYTKSYLGISAYPSAVIDRNGIYFPVETIDGNTVISNPASPLWWDAVESQMSKGAVADVNFGTDQPEWESGPCYRGKELIVPMEVTYAMDKEDLNLCFLTIITEDGVPGFQASNTYNNESPFLGEWGKGGIYGKAMVSLDFDHVARGVLGSTYLGTPGLFPTSAKAGEKLYAVSVTRLPDYVTNPDNCHVIAVLMDGHTGKIINCVTAPIKSTTSIHETTGSMADVKAYTVADGIVVEGGDRFEVAVFSLDGSLIAKAAGSNMLHMPLAHNGIMLVSVATPDGVTTFKLMK